MKLPDDGMLHVAPVWPAFNVAENAGELTRWMSAAADYWTVCVPF
jgi:hypothetical protein